MAWQNSNAYRWLMYLYQHGGQLLDASLTGPAINSKAGIEAIAWTQSWFKSGSGAAKHLPEEHRADRRICLRHGKIAMILNGDWQIPFIQEQAKFKWGVTYMPRDVAMASDLGGNSLAVSRDSKNPAAAADFLKFMVADDAMRDFVTKAQLLPVSKSLITQGVSTTCGPMR